MNKATFSYHKMTRLFPSLEGKKQKQNTKNSSSEKRVHRWRLKGEKNLDGKTITSYKSITKKTLVLTHDKLPREFLSRHNQMCSSRELSHSISSRHDAVLWKRARKIITK
jgi:hypothetical protein